ncbi:hypothetical protein [Rhodococcus opacus]|uniref:Uncharacterized protein n=1 Tax=Rhodococcus opacus TaxID=37919 RepID=A0A076F104_RHOOP|nr:hypothetical protein [Rhodococcus opacus]AII11107.1 hypothetical protein EP51_44400 [Rhodococcus opacus]
MTATALHVNDSARFACNAIIALADQLDTLGRYDLPDDVTTAASTAQHITDILKVAYQVAFAYHHAIPAPKDALKIYDVRARSDLRAIRRHSLFAFRAGYDAHRCFADIPAIAHVLHTKNTGSAS